VTGASRNIGKAIAGALASAGASVVLNANRSRDELESAAAGIVSGGGKAAAILADVSDPEAVERMVREAVSRFGRLDMLVNNAAPRHESPLEDLTFADWRRTVGAVLDGAFLCVKAGLPHLKTSGAGAIVNISGMSAHTGAPHRAHNGSAKAGLEGLTRALALELGADGITVNCVVPGFIDTARQRPAAPKAVLSKLPLGRRAPPGEVAAMVRYLCGPDARFITGQVLHVNGGVYLGG
jgi:3-oxoacyl-[acyl-carrier protein] reductase